MGRDAWATEILRLTTTHEVEMGVGNRRQDPRPGGQKDIDTLARLPTADEEHRGWTATDLGHHRTMPCVGYHNLGGTVVERGGTHGHRTTIGHHQICPLYGASLQEDSQGTEVIPAGSTGIGRTGGQTDDHWPAGWEKCRQGTPVGRLNHIGLEGF